MKQTNINGWIEWAESTQKPNPYHATQLIKSDDVIKFLEDFIERFQNSLCSWHLNSLNHQLNQLKNGR